MKRKELKKYLEKIAEEKSITLEQVIDAFSQSLEAGCRKEHSVSSCRAVVNVDKDEIVVYKQQEVIDYDNFDFSEIVKDDRKKNTYLDYKVAVKNKSKIQVGDILETIIDPSDYDLNAARDVKNKFNELLNVYHLQFLNSQYYKQIGKIISGRVISLEQKGYRIEIGNDITTLLFFNQCLQSDNYHVGDRVNVIVTGSDLDDRNKLTVRVSRTTEDIVKELLMQSVPEIREGIVVIKGISRDPGDRSKVCVASLDDKIDPIGACIGESGSRIRSVKKALNGENIDLFKYSDDPKELIANSLQPADVLAVVDCDPLDKIAVVIVKNDQFSLAIGKKGQNVSLARTAINWNKIDIFSEDKAAEEGIVY